MSQEKSLTYTSYLALEEILAAQRPRSDEHDEILFIVVHQVYELWFKQLIHELRYLQRMLEEGNDARAFATFKRLLGRSETVRLEGAPVTCVSRDGRRN